MLQPPGVPSPLAEAPVRASLDDMAGGTNQVIPRGDSAATAPDEESVLFASGVRHRSGHPSVPPRAGGGGPTHFDDTAAVLYPSGVWQSAKEWVRERWRHVARNETRRRLFWARLRRVLTWFLVLCLVYVAWLFVGSDGGGGGADAGTTWGRLEYVGVVTHKGMRDRIVQAGEQGVDWRRASTPFTCTELRTGQSEGGQALEDAQRNAQKAMQDAALACICGPMFNLTRRYLRTADGTHLYNPVVERATNSRSKVTESQAFLWPARAAKPDKQVIRYNNVIISAVSRGTCEEHKRTLVDSDAWCAQSCIDLLDGKTIYD